MPHLIPRALGALAYAALVALLALLVVPLTSAPALAEPPPRDVDAAAAAYQHVQDCPEWAVRIEPTPAGPRAVCRLHGDLAGGDR